MSSSKTVRKLEAVSPVPADIDIANSVQPFHISEIANELNLNPEHYDLYGKYKAKVSKSISLSMYVSLKKKKNKFCILMDGLLKWMWGFRPRYRNRFLFLCMFD